ncbi:hypothetical protein BASA61_003501 [Batrachochytrium salamandrivorans]|nr:hypothetical protein BASA61_003501 [Batrachochytrium salamandrivorans]
MVKTLRMRVSRPEIMFVPGGLICTRTPLPTPQYDRIMLNTDCSYWSGERADALGNNRITIVVRRRETVTAPWNGWNNLKGPWMIGNGVKYVGKVDSSIDAFFTAPVGTKINIGIDVTLDSEPGRDFLYLSAKSSGGVEDFLIRSKSLDGKKMLNGISGRKRSVKGTVSFTTKSERFSVSLKFTSKWATAFAGATINSLTVSAA